MKAIILPAAAVALIAIAQPADAHIPTVTADCRMLSVELVDYEPGTVASITIDGKTTRHTFTGDWAGGAPYPSDKAHTWKVTVDNRGDGVRDEWDQTWSGTTTPCVTPTTTRVLEDRDLTPPPTTTRHVAEMPVVINPPVVIDTQVVERPSSPPPPADVVLAFTGARTTGMLIGGWSMIGVGALLLAWQKRRLSTLRNHPRRR